MAGLFVHLMPVFGVLLAWLFLGERLAPYHMAGIVLILTGIFITSRLGRRAVSAAGAAPIERQRSRARTRAWMTSGTRSASR